MSFFLWNKKMLCNWLFVVLDFIFLWNKKLLCNCWLEVLDISMSFLCDCQISEDIKTKLEYTLQTQYGQDVRGNTTNRLITDAWDSMQRKVSTRPKNSAQHCIYPSPKHSIHFIRLSQKSAQNKFFFSRRQYLKHSIQLKYTI